MDRIKKEKLDRMFHPSGVAVFGSVYEPGKFGNMVLRSLLKYGYSGNIYPIHPRGGEVMGLRVYRSTQEVKGPIDLATVSVPANGVLSVLEECLSAGVPGAQVLTAGFSETGDHVGEALQEKIADVARRGLCILGPNCFGIHCPAGGITFLSGFDFAQEPGPVAFISQSGAVATEFGLEARMAGLGISKNISFGNGCDLDGVELLDYLASDRETRFVGAYLEGVGDGKRFVEVLGHLCRKKPTVIWKGGLTSKGSRAVQSHTGSLSGKREIWEGAILQAGAVPVQGMDEMVDTLMAFVHLRRRGRRTALIGGAGGVGVSCSDLVEQWGMDMPRFGEKTQRRLQRYLPMVGTSTVNPLDIGNPIMPAEVMIRLMEEILSREAMDALLVVFLIQPLLVAQPFFLEMGAPGGPWGEEYFQMIMDEAIRLTETYQKDVIFVMQNSANLESDLEVEGIYRRVRHRFNARGIPVYPSIYRALLGLRNANLIHS